MRSGLRRCAPTILAGLLCVLGSGRVHAGGAGGSNRAARAADLWLAPAGSDANAGTSAAAPLATLREALRRAAAGTTVHVLPGRYVESARVRARGAEGSPIRVIGEGGRPLFDGRRALRWGLWLEESAYVELEGLEFRDYTDIGLLVVSSEHVTARRLRVHGNGFEPRIGWVEGYGIHLDDSSDLLVERSRFWDNGPDPRPPDEAGTGINGFAMRRAVIQRNRSWGNHGGGILVEDSFDVLVKKNRVWGNDLDVSVDEWWDGGLWVDGGADVLVIANRFWDHLGPGIEISDEDCQQPTGYRLRRNISSGNYFGIFVWNFGSDTWPDPSVLSLRGNDFAGNSRLDVWIEADGTDCRQRARRRRGPATRPGRRRIHGRGRARRT